MIEEDVNVLTGHTPKSIIARHYIDTSRIKAEYKKATQDLKLLPIISKQPKEPTQQEFSTTTTTTTTTTDIQESNNTTTTPPPP